VLIIRGFCEFAVFGRTLARSVRRTDASSSNERRNGWNQFSSFHCQQTECFMLVLTRKYQEKIRIGENITITVLRMKGKAVRLGIEAPANVPVVRGELSFEAAPSDEGEPSTIEIDSMEIAGNRSGRLVAGIAGMSTEWATDSHPAATKNDDKQEAVKVGFSRMRRDKVSQLMPKLVAGTAPLRAMMDQRS
jgi:carbon storage regulator CsrA